MRKLLTQWLIFCILAFHLSAPCNALAAGIAWTEEELAFIAAHPVIRLGVDPAFVPFEFIDKDGAYQGITADYLSLIRAKTGIRFEVVKGLDWPEAYDMALSGGLDVLPAVSKTADREQHFLFSDSYYHFKRVIVTRDTETGISGIEDLQGLTVAVQRNSSHHSYLLSQPNINLSIYESVEAALTAVADGSERVFVGNLATANYLIRANGLTNLKFTAFEAEEEQSLRFAVRKDWPTLVGILDKALRAITEEEKATIRNRWIYLEQETDYGPLLRACAGVGAFLAVVLAVSFYWIARLKKEVAERKRIQADLEKAKQEAEEANRFKSNFMARMSHEIRTPLGAITGMAYLMKKTKITLTQKMYMDHITQASANMLGIVNDLLDFSKIESGKVELEATSFSMDRVIHDAVNIVSYKIEEQKTKLKLSKDPSMPNWFFGDPKRMEQILLNVLSNAAKFTSSGEISLDVRLAEREEDICHLVFCIKDTGIGMTKEQVEKLFTPFTQGDSSINRRFGGSGLGLSIVKSLVELMGGQIEVSSATGEGSTFWIHLGLRVDQEKEDAYAEALSAAKFKYAKTLVLEKTEADTHQMERCLSAFGMQCACTTSSAAALSMLSAAGEEKGEPFDLLILDYEAPAEGGFAFVASMRQNKSIARMPKIILLLPMMREDLFDRLEEYEIDVGIGKPVIPSLLFNGILGLFREEADPAARPDAHEAARPAALEHPHRVLVVEDNGINQLIARSLLQQMGIESIVASDGKAAVALFEQHVQEIDLILMDLHMPVMNGYEAAQEIRKLSPGVPIVAMTADVMLEVRERCEQSGMHYYISKPFDPDALLETVQTILGEREAGRTQALPALDVSVGLQRMGGDKSLYALVLREYWQENQETSDRICRAVAEKRYADAAQIVHKVKGSAGSVGARQLHDLSIQLQKALENEREDQIPALTKQFSNSFSKLLAEIAALEG